MLALWRASGTMGQLKIDRSSPFILGLLITKRAKGEKLMQEFKAA